jgi:ABC-2 type transport system permease protein
MKYAFLVAWREYAESAKAKGFWLSIWLMPVMLFLSIQVPIWLDQKATPVRHFILVDQSASLEPVINSTLERAHQNHVLEALQEYARKYAAAPAAPGAAGLLSVENFISQGGEQGFLQRLRPSLKPGAPPFKTPRWAFQRTHLPASLNTNAELPALVQELKPYLRGDRKVEADGQPVDLSIAILIPRDIEKQIVRPQPGKTRGTNENKGIEFWSTDVASMKGGSGLAHDIEQAVNAEVRRREYVSRGMDAAAIRQVEQTYAPFLSFNPKKEAGQEAVNTTDVIKQWLPSGFVYLLWLAIFVIVQMLLNNTIEEKSNRIIEVLLSSVTPGELMMGKLFGIAATGLTMVGAWMLALFGILNWKAGGASEIAGQMLTVVRTSNLIPLFCVYFLLGYLMYAAFILSIGSVCNTIKEAQSYMGLLTMVMMVPLLTMTFIPKDPNGMLARLLSWIPLYTPFTMMNRANADPPLVDLLGTLILLVLTTSVALWMSGKIFRIGVLRTGQPPKIIEMLRWVKG